jgi:dynactin-4
MGLRGSGYHIRETHWSRRYVPRTRVFCHLIDALAQLQKFEDSAPDSLEFERLKEHFEPVIRASSLSSSTSNAPAAHPSSAAHSHRVRTNSITAAASAALARDIPGVNKYNPLARSARSNKDKTANKDEMPEYRSRVDISSASGRGTGGGEADVDYMRHLESVNEVANLEQRWVSSWATSLQTA